MMVQGANSNRTFIHTVKDKKYVLATLSMTPALIDTSGLSYKYGDTVCVAVESFMEASAGWTTELVNYGHLIYAQVDAGGAIPELSLTRSFGELNTVVIIYVLNFTFTSLAQNDVTYSAPSVTFPAITMTGKTPYFQLLHFTFSHGSSCGPIISVPPSGYSYYGYDPYAEFGSSHSSYWRTYIFWKERKVTATSWASTSLQHAACGFSSFTGGKIGLYGSLP